MLPVQAAAVTVLCTILVISFYQMAGKYMDAAYAMLVTAFVAAGVMYLEYDQRWRRHDRIFRETLRRLEGLPPDE